MFKYIFLIGLEIDQSSSNLMVVNLHARSSFEELLTQDL